MESLPHISSLWKANLDSARESTKELSKVINRRIDFSMLPRDVLLYMSEWLVEKDRFAVASVCKTTREEMKGCCLERINYSINDYNDNEVKSYRKNAYETQQKNKLKFNSLLNSTVQWKVKCLSIEYLSLKKSSEFVSLVEKSNTLVNQNRITEGLELYYHPRPEKNTKYTEDERKIYLESMQSLATSLKANTVKNLTWDGSTTSGRLDVLKYFIQGLEVNTSLEYLNIPIFEFVSYFKADERTEAARLLGDALSKVPIKDFYADENYGSYEIEFDCILDGLFKNNHLEEISFHNIVMDEVGASKFGKTIERRLKDNTGLRRLEFYYTNISLEALASIAEGLKTNCTLKELSLERLLNDETDNYGNVLHVPDFKLFFQSLAVNTGLRKLQFTNTYYYEQEDEEWSFIGTKRATYIAEMLAKNTTLEYFNTMCYNSKAYITDEANKIMFDALQKNNTLKEVVSSTRATTDGSPVHLRCQCQLGICWYPYKQ